MSLRVNSRLAICGAAVLIVGAVALLMRSRFSGEDASVGESVSPPAQDTSIDRATLNKLCTHCHLFPPPDSLPRSVWPEMIRGMTELKGYGTGFLKPPPKENVIAWYRSQAPESLSLAAARGLPQAAAQNWKAAPVKRLGAELAGFTSNVCVYDVTGDGRPDLVASDLSRPDLAGSDPKGGRVVLWNDIQSREPAEVPVGKVPYPAHIEPIDFDGDGLCDLLVANLGSFSAIDHNQGSVEWFRQRSAGSFEKITLVKGLGRVADVRAGDLDGDGDLDLVVAEFGWKATGKILTFENTGSPQSSPQPDFIRRDLDSRGGAVHVPLLDIDGDGRLDIVALLGQQYEIFACFLNTGGFAFTPREPFRGPHPAWGATGLAPVDLDQDGDIDFLITNGDSFDDHVLKPYHGVTWLENTGGLNFSPHTLVTLPGAHRALAVDADGDGDLDIIACSYAGETSAKTTGLKELPSLIVLEQTAPGRFVAGVLERGNCDYPTLDIIGRSDSGLLFAVGHAGMLLGQKPPAVTIWELKR